MMEQFKMMGALAGLMKNQQKLREIGEEVKRKLAELRVTAETGGGAVRATASGSMRIISVELEPSLFSGLVGSGGEDDRMLAEDLITGAVNAALEKAQLAAQEEVSSAMGGLGLPDIPADLTNLLGG